MTSPAPAANPILRLDRVRKAFAGHTAVDDLSLAVPAGGIYGLLDRKSTRLNSSHSQISYAVFCLKKKNKNSNSCIGRAVTGRVRFHVSHVRTPLSHVR